MRIVFGENALMNMNGRPITNMRKDGDIYFFDVLASQPRNHPEEEGLLNHIRPHIEQHLITHKNGKPAVYEKYVWYANYFNQVAKECGAKPIDF